MIVFDLQCERGHRFEGWFGSSTDYEQQSARGLLACPECASMVVSKAPMAPAVPTKGNATDRAVQPPAHTGTAAAAANTAPVAGGAMSPELHQAMQALALAQARALRDSTWVGTDFAAQSRAMHYGEREEAAIHGQASLEEARALIEEGVPVAPLPFPVAPPDKIN